MARIRLRSEEKAAHEELPNRHFMQLDQNDDICYSRVGSQAPKSRRAFKSMLRKVK